MRKLILALIILLPFYAHAHQLILSDCSTIREVGYTCYNTVDGKTYKGTGTGSVELGGGGSFSGTLDDITDGTIKKGVTTTEKSTWNGKQDAIGFTPVNTTDSRLSDSRTPVSHSHSTTDVTGTAVVTGDSRLSDARTLTSHSHATTDVTGTAVVTNDSRLSDARTPTAHNQAWSTITSGVPTTLSGYGITDAEPLIGTSAATSATTGTMTVNMTTDIITITPTGACTFNAAAGGNLGRIVTFVITTSGTSTFTLTWGTNYRKTGTLATGTTSARFFAVTFRYVGTNTWMEIARTAVQT